MRRIPLVAGVLVAVTSLAACGGSAQQAGKAVAAEASQVPADYVATTQVGFDAFTPQTPLDPAQACLIGPHTAVAFSGVATVPEVTAEQVAALRLVDPRAKGGLRPADGHEFLVLRLARPAVPWAGVGTGGVLTLRTGDETRPLDGTMSADMTLTLSIRSGRDAVLVLTDEGKVQTLNLRTGQRAGEGNPLYSFDRSTR